MEHESVCVQFQGKAPLLLTIKKTKEGQKWSSRISKKEEKDLFN